MNTKSKFTRFVFALLLALSALGISTSTALAGKPTKSEWSITQQFDFEDLCQGFIVHQEATTQTTETDHFNKDGELTRINFHSVEQDTFTANGHTLVGIPYTYHLEILFDSDGNITDISAEGVLEKVPLPDGSWFFSAGRVDLTGVAFTLTPDHGNSGNIEGLCAALAP